MQKFVVSYRGKDKKKRLCIAEGKRDLDRLLKKLWRIRATALIYKVEETPGKARALALPGLWTFEEAKNITSGGLGYE